MSQQFLGEVRLMPYNFAPKGWAYCAGQILSIQQNTALFSLLGTTYGGNGVSTFALPDLRGRAPIGIGTSPSGITYVEGEVAGQESVTLIVTELPMHNHMWQADNTSADSPAPANNYLSSPHLPGANNSPINTYASPGSQVPLAPGMCGLTGGNQPHNNMQPYLVLAYCIALQGVFPSRN
ncbi:tail fiber protein [Sphingomonas sp.]|uniref:phage tail protein n=1 Tax=Sphingomonas sp. TaxID=28214 RepID=UPI001B06F6C8|nr:tail fiber protein [Sphingomonas sp.]MBO9715031.1 phage tail protein [Sphingomonas sp.]